MLKTLFGNSAKDSRKKREGKKTLMLCRKVDYRGQLKAVKVQPGANAQSSRSRSSVNSGSGSNLGAYSFFFCFFFFGFFLPGYTFDLEQWRNTSSVRHEREKKKKK